jgi:oxygen-independent coproporphyrinogen III oxidase
MQIPEILIQKYNIPVPRYTSYPPANYFHNDFKEEDYLKAVEASNTNGLKIFHSIFTYRSVPKCVIFADAIPILHATGKKCAGM